MKQIKKMLLITLSASSLLYSCSGNNNADINKDSTASPTSSTENPSENSSGAASFSCKIDGRDFSGKGNADNLAAVKSGSGLVTFALVHIEPNQQGIPEELHFTVADHGTTTMHNYSNGPDNGNYSANYSPRDYLDAFGFNEVTVTVTWEASGIKGTFSGTLFNPQSKKEFSVTDGKFDLPWSPYSKK